MKRVSCCHLDVSKKTHPMTMVAIASWCEIFFGLSVLMEMLPMRDDAMPGLVGPPNKWLATQGSQFFGIRRQVHNHNTS
jgi:hypothetical protein